MKGILKEYEKCLSQCVNFDKSIVFYNSNTPTCDRSSVTDILEMRSSNEPERYLSLPTIIGKNKKFAFQILKDHFHQRVYRWSVRCLSQRGKEDFVKSILQSTPTYSMSCFILPKSLCDDLEQIMGNFWSKKGAGKKGVYWCEWKHLCILKEYGGMGFKSLMSFDTTLLTKQGWRILNYPNSLLSFVLKVKYFPHTNFLQANLRHLPSYNWRSICTAKGLLFNGLCWRVGLGDQISIRNDAWLLGSHGHRIEDSVNDDSLILVSNLTNLQNREWNRELAQNTISNVEVMKILKISLSLEVHDDIRVSEEFMFKTRNKFYKKNDYS